MNSLCIGFDGRILSGTFRGMARYTYGLLSALVREAPENNYIVYSDRPLTVAVPDPVVVRRVPSGYMWSSRVLPRAVNEDKVDIVHFPFNTSWYYPYKKTIVTLHDINPIISRHYGIKTRLLYLLYLIAMSYTASAIITDSHSSAESIRRYWPLLNSKISVIYPGVRLTERPRIVPSPERKRPYILFIGGCDPNKNLLIVVEALSQVSNLHLYIVGHCKEGQYTKAVRDKIRRHDLGNRVHFVGRSSEDTLISLYQEAFVLAFVSFNEGFGFPILEAMHYGVPVITSNASSMREIAGTAAVLIDPNDVDRLVQSIRMLQENPDQLQLLREKGRARVAKFSWEEAAVKTLEVYDYVHRR